MFPYHFAGITGIGGIILGSSPIDFDRLRKNFKVMGNPVLISSCHNLLENITHNPWMPMIYSIIHVIDPFFLFVPYHYGPTRPNLHSIQYSPCEKFAKYFLNRFWLKRWQVCPFLKGHLFRSWNTESPEAPCPHRLLSRASSLRLRSWSFFKSKSRQDQLISSCLQTLNRPAQRFPRFHTRNGPRDIHHMTSHVNNVSMARGMRAVFLVGIHGWSVLEGTTWHLYNTWSLLLLLAPSKILFTCIICAGL